MARLFAKFLSRAKPEDSSAEQLYRALVAQAREPDLYRLLGVADTVEGRLEMILLHLVLLFHRLHKDGDEGQAVAQAVFDRFTVDMDRSLREMGVGDMSVPKRMKAIGQSFYGRLDVYGRPLAERDGKGLADALERTLRPAGPIDGGSQRLAAYAKAAVTALNATAFDLISAGRVAFPKPGATLDEELAR
jgi:cytochrome b pre-mRNA-processing protein 3